MYWESVSDIVRVTDDLEEMLDIAHKVVDVLPGLYTPLMMDKMHEGARDYCPNASEEEIELLIYRSIYDYWVHGCNIDEECYLHFYEKNDAEKREYLVQRLRHVYIHHLNGRGDDRVDMLEDKYRLYKTLEPYYLRDMIELKDESDFYIFKDFISRHETFVVKPSDFCYGTGVHMASLASYGNDAKQAFDAIMSEGLAIKDRHPTRSPKMVLEELIIQDETMTALHPYSVNSVRATAVRGKDGKLHLFHPWLAIGMNGSFVTSNGKSGFYAEIDPETGVIITDGHQEDGSVYTVHPNTGIKIKGFRIPRWDELIVLVDQIMAKLPGFGYVGWDLVLTPKGWCVMEGNYSGEFMFQLMNGRGMKKEFEELIGWKYAKDYWWQENMDSDAEC